MRSIALFACLLMASAALGQQTYPNVEGETLLEDDRVIVQRFVLEPGEWEGIHEHPEHQLVIVLNATEEVVYQFRGSERSMTRTEEELENTPSAFWRPGPVLMSDEHQSGNMGTRPLEWIAITFKSDSIALDEPLEQFVQPEDEMNRKFQALTEFSETMRRKASDVSPDELMTSADLADFDNPSADERIPYGDDPLQFGDLRLPDGKGPHPVAIFIHGGKWMAEFDISHSDNLTDALARSGIATWSLEYRRVGNPGGGWPGTFQDIARGADHLRVIAPNYNLDVDRVMTMGHSAGGQLALWLASRSAIPADSDVGVEKPIAVSGVLALAPAAGPSRIVRVGLLRRRY